jgi:hypothetical protein
VDQEKRIEEKNDTLTLGYKMHQIGISDPEKVSHRSNQEVLYESFKRII